MAEYLVQDTSLTAVADAIRTKGDTSGSLVFPGDFVSAIEGISSGHSLAVLVPVNSSVTIGKDGETYTNIADSNGVTIFSNLSKGTWSVTVSDGTTSKTETVEITEDCIVKIVLNAIPSFTYDGDYEIVNDLDVNITTSIDNWKIRFLTSGTLTFTNLNGAANGIDVFCVGGGGNSTSGGGGGGGYTTTEKGVSVSANTTYTIVVGGAAGASSGFGVSANGGSSTSSNDGGNGGSGGARGPYSNGSTMFSYKGGSDGSDGGGSDDAWTKVGKGQGTTTREFGEENATLYAGGGGGGHLDGGAAGAGGAGGGGHGAGGHETAGSGTANTGGGAGGKGAWATAAVGGGSGIVIIRNAR